MTATDCSQRAARQVRTLLSDAQRQPVLLQLTDRSDVSASHTAPAEGTLYFDGGATPSPGLGGAGYWLLDDRNVEVARCAIGIYPYHGVTNNQAEYITLIQGMIKAQDNRQGDEAARSQGRFGGDYLPDDGPVRVPRGAPRASQMSMPRSSRAPSSRFGTSTSRER